MPGTMMWSSSHQNAPPTGSTVDGAPHGKRIAALMPVETLEAQQAQRHVIFLENFSDELKRKVAAGK